jgi:multiple sugar transport system ATP-binding protein
MAEIALEALTKIYPDGTKAVSEVSFEIPDGSVMVLVGPSGCGKTSILRMVAGLEPISGGTLRIGGEVVNDVSARDRDIAMVFQNYALYPHMTVRENMGFSLKIRKDNRAHIASRVEGAAAVLGLTEYLDRRPAQLSGGQRQRVAMGRAIVREPRAFLMDEPLSNLDAKLRVRMRAEILRLLRNVGVTTMYVTHDQTEAMTMGDIVAVMRDGVVEQLDTPQALYDRPATSYVAGFIGSPAMNLAEADVHFDGPAARLTIGSIVLELDEAALASRQSLRAFDAKKIVVGIRPEDLQDASVARTGSRLRFRVGVELCEALGSDVLAHFEVAAHGIRVGVEEETLELEGDRRTTFVARLHAQTGARDGQPIELALDPGALYFFDAATGVAVRD